LRGCSASEEWSKKKTGKRKEVGMKSPPAEQYDSVSMLRLHLFRRRIRHTLAPAGKTEQK